MKNHIKRFLRPIFKVTYLIQKPYLRFVGLHLAQKFQTEFKVLKLDLGCGACSKEGFIGIDLSQKSNLRWDLEWGLPFQSDTISEIRSDHFLEHLSLPAVFSILQECWRVLKVGGVLDISVPHIDPYLKAYLSGDTSYLKEKINDVPEGHEFLYQTGFDRISWLLHRSGEHLSLFDRESIVDKVKLSGFEKIEVRDFDPDKDINQRFSSIYITAVK